MSDIIEYPTPEQRKVAYAVYSAALRSGVLVRASACAWCASACKTHGHHPDYARPLAVVWLCRTCHAAHHQKFRLDKFLVNDEAWHRVTHGKYRGTVLA